jgi:hypothetical protein
MTSIRGHARLGVELRVGQASSCRLVTTMTTAG